MMEMVGGGTDFRFQNSVKMSWRPLKFGTLFKIRFLRLKSVSKSLSKEGLEHE